MNLFFWRPRRLKSVYRLEKQEKTALLAGTAHFCPYSFAKPLTTLIAAAEIVVFEGPLDKESMARVVSYGRDKGDMPSLYQALDPEAIRELNSRLASVINGNNPTGSFVEFLKPPEPDYVEEFTRDIRPWLAFFTIWSTLLDWKHSMDVEAFNIASKLNKRIHFLETIEDQVQAMEGIPFERFVNFLNNAAEWKSYKTRYLKTFLGGDIESFKNVLAAFPTRCDSILTARDPIFFNGIKEAMRQGKTTAFVGNAHVPGLLSFFAAEGYNIDQVRV